MKKIYNTLLLLTALLVYSSCVSEVEDSFDKSSAERVEEALKADMSILTSATNGWVMQYYASEQYGGYNVLCKFNTDNTVTVMNEVIDSETTATSHFKLEQSKGIILSFDEYNELFHYFSDPSNPDGIGNDGTGMGGDFEFRIQEISAEKIVLVGKKHGSRIVMTPLDANTEWKTYIESVYDTEAKMASANYKLVVGDKEMAISKSYRVLSFVDPETNNEVTMAYIQTPTGFVLHEPLTYNGVTITGFTYSENDIWLNPEDNTAYLAPVVPPLSEQFMDGLWFIGYSNMSTMGKPYWNVMKSGASSIGETIVYAMIGKYTLDKNNSFGLTFCSFDGASGWWGKYLINCEAKSDDEVTLEFTGSGVLNANYYTSYKYHYGCFPFGYMGTPRTFKLTTDNVKNPAYIIMTDESDANNVIKVTKDEIYDVFAN